MVRLGAIVGVIVVAAAVAWPARAVASAPQPLFRLTDPQIDEASGIAAGITSPGVLYVQNDSGDSARFFALDARTGKTLASYRVPGATNVDWEDIAVARDRRGVPSVWLADIGDNDSARAEVRVYRVDEPRVDVAQTGLQAPTGRPDVWRLRYPDGPTDAESLAVAPGGAAYVLTKSIFGGTKAFALPTAPNPGRVQTLRAVGAIDFEFTGTSGGPNPIGQVTATGAALSADGSVLAVRTYTDAYLWRVRDGEVAAALRREPVRVALPAQPQGEGIAVDGGRLIIDSERVGSSVFALPLPRLAAVPAPSGRAASPRPGAGDSVTASPPRAAHDRAHRGLVVAGGLAAVAALVLLVVGRARSRRGDH